MRTEYAYKLGGIISCRNTCCILDMLCMLNNNCISITDPYGPVVVTIGPYGSVAEMDNICIDYKATD